MKKMLINFWFAMQLILKLLALWVCLMKTLVWDTRSPTPTELLVSSEKKLNICQRNLEIFEGTCLTTAQEEIILSIPAIPLISHVLIALHLVCNSLSHICPSIHIWLFSVIDRHERIIYGGQLTKQWIVGKQKVARTSGRNSHREHM